MVPTLSKAGTIALEPRWSPDSALIRFPSQSESTGQILFCRWARFAFVSLRSVVLDLGV